MSGFRWVTVKSEKEMTDFFLSLLPDLRTAARRCGYALGVHGSLKRDLDLIAVPWVEEYSTKDILAKELQMAACGLSREKHVWEEKPHGRWATCFPICFPEFFPDNRSSLGHVDLSVLEIKK